MSSMSRSIERSIVKHRCRVNDGHEGNFKEEWNKYRDAKAEQAKNSGSVNAVKTKTKKKQSHFDNGKLAIRQWLRMKEMFANMKKQTNEVQTDN